MQGDSKIQRHKAIRFAAVLTAAHVAMAGFVVALLYQLGTIIAANMPRDAALGICTLTAMAAIVVDIRAMRNNTYSIGLKRQTAKSLSHRAGWPWWVTPLFWGLDTGLIWSTFRVSCTSWVLLLSALLNIAPQWSGLIYGILFGIPLLLAVSTGDPEKFGRSGISPPLRLVQGLGVTVMAVLPIGAIMSSYAII